MKTPNLHLLGSLYVLHVYSYFLVPNIFMSLIFPKKKKLKNTYSNVCGLFRFPELKKQILQVLNKDLFSIKYINKTFYLNL